MTNKKTANFDRKLTKLRELINLNDQSLLQILASRFQITKQIGQLKKESSIQITDSKREDLLRDIWLKEGVSCQLRPGFVNDLLNLILTESKEQQNKDK